MLLRINKALYNSAAEYWPLLIGFAVLYIPTFFDLFSGLWLTEEQFHAPILFFLSVWLIYRNLPLLKENYKYTSSSFYGWPVFLCALFFYIIGRSQQIVLFELLSFILMLTSVLLIKLGNTAFKIMWFPLFFMLFMIPLPGTFVTMLTLPMKVAVSYVADNVLYWANYPIARNGVILQIAQYRLLVADACAGLSTLLTLEALGLFYLNLVKHNSVFRNITLAILIVPISFTANVIRVIALTLVTYYWGDEAGQGFLHRFAGLVLFISALTLIISLDAMLQYIAKHHTKNQTASSE